MKQFNEGEASTSPVVLDARAFRDYRVHVVPGAFLARPDGKVRFRLREEIINARCPGASGAPPA
jgi:hypothetical protein